MAEPPVVVGALKATDADALLGVAVTPVTGPGTVVLAL
jgi:hypothetical protein